MGANVGVLAPISLTIPINEGQVVTTCNIGNIFISGTSLYYISGATLQRINTTLIV